MNVIFEVFPYLFGIMFVTIFIIFVSILLSSLARKKQDDASPRLTVSAQVVSLADVYDALVSKQNGASPQRGLTQYGHGDRHRADGLLCHVSG